VALKLKIVDPNKILFDGEAKFVMAPGVKGMLGIFPGHTAMYAELVEGEIIVEGESNQNLAISKGILRVRGDVLTILVNL